MERGKLTLTERQRLTLGLLTSIVLLLDNITTWLAVDAGAVEVNPLVQQFLGTAFVWVLFTIAKAVTGFCITYYSIRDTRGLLVWVVVLYFFVRAVLINTYNYLVLQGSFEAVFMDFLKPIMGSWW